ncbi:MAG: SagB family peptide dehydrogenase [Candidatus Hodarchaeota archaeon]
MEKTANTFLKLKFIILVGILVGSVFFLLVELFPPATGDLSLPEPIKKGKMPLSIAMNQVRQSEDLRDHSIKKNNISQLLWALQGITHGPSFRTVPSAGATYPLEIFLLQKKTSTMNEGCYRYIPHDHRLKSISTSENFTLLLSALLGEDQEAVSNVSTVFLILADYARTTQRYNSPHYLYPYRGIQYVHLEVGHAIQNFLLQLTSLNLDTRVITNFTSQKIQNFLNTKLDPMIILPVGIRGNQNSLLFRFKPLTLENSEEMTVEEAIIKRKSVRDYLSGKIPLSMILDILNDSLKNLRILDNSPPLDLRLVVGEINGLQNGSYKFFLENSSLSLLSQGDLRSPLKEAGLNQIWIERAQLDIVISVDTTWIDQQADPVLYHRIMMYDVGMFAQNVYLKCAANGLGTVVVGAFYEGLTSQVVNIPNTHTPIYIMPIGLTAEYFEEDADYQLPLTDLARVSGLLSYIPFYICLYLSLPVFRRRITKKMHWIHCIFGIIPFIGVIFHFMVIHGHVRDLWDFMNINSYINALIRFISDIISLPITRYDLGILLANLNILLGAIAATTGIIFAFKLVRQRKLMKTIHKWTIFSLIAAMILHALLNGTLFANRPLIFLLLNILALDLYFLLYISPDIVKAIYQQEFFPQ